MPPPPIWRMSPSRSLVLDRPRLLAVVNATPDSFYAGSRTPDPHEALARAAQALAQGADALDVGGESTRPGAARVGAEEQLARVLPLLHAIRAAPGPLAHVPITIDTTLPEVAHAALDAGADAINDVSGALEGGARMLALAAARGAGIILMHRLRPPERDQFSDRYRTAPVYTDVVAEVRAFLDQRASAAIHAGVPREAILLDPGLGFGKSIEHNLELVRRSRELLTLGHPLLSAASRKSFVGRVSCPEAARTDPQDRLAGSLAFSVMHLAAGARVFRVHDVGPQREALLAAWALATGTAGAD